MKNFFAIICARGGSKGLKDKNLLPFNKTTLIGNAIQHAKKSKYISRIIVSTDSKKIAKEALKCGAEVPFLRPKNISTDKSPEILYWIHIINYLKKNKSLPDYLVSVPSTSPLRHPTDIDKAITKIEKEKLDFVFSATKSSKNPFFNIIKVLNSKISIACKPKKNIYRRQDAPDCYDICTVVFVFKPSFIKKNKHLFKGKIGFVKIPKSRSSDIDDIYDYEFSKFIAKNKFN
jgi:N-acylneuraminate cytidylyltransferase